MIKVLQIREKPRSKYAGIDANSKALIELFSEDNDVQILPTLDYTRHIVPILKQYYLDKHEICNSIEEYNPDIIHIHGASTFTLLVAVRCARKYNKPICLSPHYHPTWSLRRPLMGKLFFNIITKSILKYVYTVFTINNEDTSIFLKCHNNVVKIPHWSKIKESVEYNKIKNMILFVGRPTDSNKGFEHLYYLPEGKYDIHCIGKGDIVKRSDITQHINISEEELMRLYGEASLLVVPSRYEAFSYVSLEALSCNTPILVSERVRLVDHIPNNNGYNIFKYKDFEDFVNKVESTIGKNVDVEKILKIFEPNQIKDTYKKEYLRLVINKK